MPQPPVIVVQLVHITGPMKGEIQEFSGSSISIGRHPSCDLRFPAEMTVISRNHAEIVREGNQFRLTDHSTNGTLVNGKRVREAYLRDGDVLTFTEGGPKVSFLTRMQEGVIAPESTPPPMKETPVIPAQEAPRPVQSVQPARPEAAQPAPIPARQEKVEAVSVERVRAQLVILYGPTIRTFEELPVTVGRGGRSDFMIADRPAILDQQAQFFFSKDRYFVKDLTGQGAVRLNGQPVGNQAPLKTGDELALSADGPFFQFIGEGRLAEIEKPASRQMTGSEDTEGNKPREVATETREPSGLLSRFKKKIMQH